MFSCLAFLLWLPYISTFFHAQKPFPYRPYRTSLCMKMSRGKTSLNINHSKTVDFGKYMPTFNQQQYINTLLNKNTNMILGIGPAGTGKTLFACLCAANAYESEQVEKIIITRPIVPVEEEIGYLPGSMDDKMNPWIEPMMDVFRIYFGTKQAESLRKRNIIEICPIGYMRGRTFHNAYVIADEMQNSSPKQMFMVATRMGNDSKLIVNGDLEQSDLPYGTVSGLEEFQNKFVHHYDTLKSAEKRHSKIKLVNLNESDIKRSALTQSVVELYHTDSNRNSDGKQVIPSVGISKNSNSTVQLRPNMRVHDTSGDAAMIPKNQMR